MCVQNACIISAYTLNVVLSDVGTFATNYPNIYNDDQNKAQLSYSEAYIVLNRQGRASVAQILILKRMWDSKFHQRFNLKTTIDHFLNEFGTAKVVSDEAILLGMGWINTYPIKDKFDKNASYKNRTTDREGNQPESDRAPKRTHDEIVAEFCNICGAPTHETSACNRRSEKKNPL